MLDRLPKSEFEHLETQLNETNNLHGKTVLYPKRSSLPKHTQLPTILPASRVALMVDDSNLFHSAKDLGYEFSYEALLEKFINVQLTKAIVFRVEPEYLPKGNGSTKRLTSLGYQVITKTLQICSNGKKKGDTDIDLVCQTFYLIPKIDELFLATGDGDFIPLVTLLQRHSIAVHIIGFKFSTSHNLIQVADGFVPVGRDLLQGGEADDC